jgi:hypothetical protein
LLVDIEQGLKRTESRQVSGKIIINFRGRLRAMRELDAIRRRLISAAQPILDKTAGAVVGAPPRTVRRLDRG